MKQTHSKNTLGIHLLLVAALLQLMMSCTSQSPNPPAKVPHPKDPNYSCYRHIYNNTGCTWTFYAVTSAGNVWFLDEGTPCKANCTNPNGPCTLPPNCTVAIQYTTGLATISGTWFAMDQNGRYGIWTYSAPLYSATCPYISHSGDTGAVSVNDPANGDLSVGACTWSVKQSKKSTGVNQMIEQARARTTAPSQDRKTRKQ